MKETELILYRNMENSQILHDLAWLSEHYESEPDRWEELAALFHSCGAALLERAAANGFYGNLWHCYLADLLVNNENAYSTSCEIVGEVEGSLNQAALHDFKILREFFLYDFSQMAEILGGTFWPLIENFENGDSAGKVYNTRIRDRICHVAQQLSECRTAEQMKDVMTAFYRDYGVGRFGLHKAFRVERNKKGVQICPISRVQHVYLEDLVGYESAKQKLIENTEAFVEGRSANNCLLFGDAGTGKSTSIKGIMNRYYDKGLRVIELYKHQLREINDVIAQIKGRNYKFIIYMDDLSFEEFETEYKYLKAIIEGGLEKKPRNVLIYATSNRRHLIRETFRDKEERDEELHTNDTVQEKLSLASRFGVTIYFGSPSKTEFNEIVLALAKRNGIDLPEDQLLLQANMWEMQHGGKSGRCAQQFIDYLLGKKGV